MDFSDSARCWGPYENGAGDGEHERYHDKFRGFCIRCDVQKNATLYASLASQAGDPWLTSARSTSGMWGLGCKDCADFLATGRKTCKDARFSKFANFAVRPTSRFQAKFLVQQHQERRSHRVASGMVRARPKGAADPPQPSRLPLR